MDAAAAVARRQGRLSDKDGGRASKALWRRGRAVREDQVEGGGEGEENEPHGGGALSYPTLTPPTPDGGWWAIHPTYDGGW
jgi:hypothetical protein